MSDISKKLEETSNSERGGSEKNSSHLIPKE